MLELYIGAFIWMVIEHFIKRHDAPRPNQYLKFIEWVEEHHGREETSRFYQCCRCGGTGIEKKKFILNDDFCLSCKGAGYLEHKKKVHQTIKTIKDLKNKIKDLPDDLPLILQNREIGLYYVNHIIDSTFFPQYHDDPKTGHYRPSHYLYGRRIPAGMSKGLLIQ